MLRPFCSHNRHLRQQACFPSVAAVANRIGGDRSQSGFCFCTVDVVGVSVPEVDWSDAPAAAAAAVCQGRESRRGELREVLTAPGGPCPLERPMTAACRVVPVRDPHRYWEAHGPVAGGSLPAGYRCGHAPPCGADAPLSSLHCAADTGRQAARGPI